MGRRLKQPPAVETLAPDADAILQVKVWLLGVSPMVWRRVLVPATFTLRELHGVIQVAMGWEGIHLYDFHLRAAHYGSWEGATSSPDIALTALRLGKGARFIYEYDLNIPWRHEVRIEDRLEPEARKTYPVWTGGGGGPESFMAHRDDRFSFDALDDLDTMVEVFQQVALKGLNLYGAVGVKDFSLASLLTNGSMTMLRFGSPPPRIVSGQPGKRISARRAETLCLVLVVLRHS